MGLGSIVGTVGGALIGGPAGAALGGSLGGAIDGYNSENSARVRADTIRKEDIALQKEFAQMGLQWKVEDAKKAGIHPLAALGAAGAGYSPVADTFTSQGVEDWGSKFGQDISRAMAAGGSREDQTMQRLQVAGLQADLDGKLLDNQIRASQIAKLNQNQTGIPNKIKIKPSEQTATATGLPHQQAGEISDVGWARTKTGYAPVPSTDVKERIEDQFIPEAMWSMRNQLLPNFGVNDPPPRSLLKNPSKNDWQWNPLRQEYRERPKGKNPTWYERNIESRFERFMKGR